MSEELREHKIPLGVHEARIGEPPARELLEFLYRPRIERHKPMFGAVVRYNMAHVVMLAEQEIIGKDDASALLRALREIEAAGVEGLTIDAEAQDIHPNIEAARTLSIPQTA
jgi:argininosuccinate lyase